MRFVKNYKKTKEGEFYTIYADGDDRYLCYKKFKIRLNPDSDNLGFNVTKAEEDIKYLLEAEKTMDYVIQDDEKRYWKKHKNKIDWGDKEARKKYLQDYEKTRKRKHI